MSAFPPPTNGFYNGATYNSLYFVDSDSTTVTKEFLAENYLPRVGAPTDIATETTFTGNVLCEDDIILSGTQDLDAIQFPNSSRQYTAMNTLPPNQTYTYATVITDNNGAISSITANAPPVPPVKIARSYGTYNSSYISFTINTNGGPSGSWSQNDYFTVRYNMSINYGPNSSSPYQSTRYGTATGTMDIYPYRFGTNWCANSNAPGLGQFPNVVNGNSNFNMTDTGTNHVGGVIAPSGRQFWSHDGSEVDGTNMFYMLGTQSSLSILIANPNGWTPTTSYIYSIEVELVNTGANKAPITTSGFNTNF